MSGLNILVTGRPGVGKTTLVQSLCAKLKNSRIVGFYTAEIRQGGKRRGFELISLDGKQMRLADIDFSGMARVGKYGIDVAGFDAFLDQLVLTDSASDFVLIDEIGKMECLSSRFVKELRRVLDSDRPLVATIAAKGGGFINEVKQRKDVQIVEVSEQNRDSLAKELKKRLKL